MTDLTNGKLEITQEQITAILNTKRGEIIDGVVAGLVESSKSSLNYEMRAAFEQTLGDEIKKIIKEESQTIAEKFRDELRKQMIEVCTQVPVMLAQKMIEKATKELEQSWTLERITKELF